MKHASPSVLDKIENVLEALRSVPKLKERSRGVFYFKGGAFLHFHEDPAGVFADLKENGEWSRYPVNAPEEAKTLLQRARKAAA